ncbi:MAG: SNF7 protein [Nitrosopumilales archaeon]|nr:MAG: SNF7 protein [Nitrosopumilales archaeon]
MGSLTNWSKDGNEGLSQKVLGKIKPGIPVKNKIDFAQKKLELQIIKLSTINEKLQKKHDHVFQKIVDAQRNSNHTYAKAYAVELQEIRKMNNMVSNAKLSMEQIQIRLNTISELGDVIVTLSPCMSVIKGLGVSLGGIMPEANSSMQDLSKVLGDVLSGSSMSTQENTMLSRQDNADTLAILEEAHSVIEGQTKANIPEIPSGLPEEILEERKEASI